MVPVERARSSPFISFMFHCLHFPLNNGFIRYSQRIYAVVTVMVCCVCVHFSSACPGDEVLKVDVATRCGQGLSGSFCALALHCHLESSKGEQKTKADKTTRKSPEIMGDTGRVQILQGELVGALC